MDFRVMYRVSRRLIVMKSNPKAACYDGLDNDNDGRVDARDPGCSSTQDMSENSEPSSTTLTGVVGTDVRLPSSTAKRCQAVCTC